MHCLYNPDEEEFLDWIAAAERETWKQIPAIKSHIAEELVLDRCVQRLRKRLLVESWEKRRNDSTNNKMTDRVPSFFVSPSLVNVSKSALRALLLSCLPHLFFYFNCLVGWSRNI